MATLEQEFEEAKAARDRVAQADLQRQFAEAKAAQAKAAKYDPGTETLPYIANELKRAVAGLGWMGGLVGVPGALVSNAARYPLGMPLLNPLGLSDIARSGVEQLLDVKSMKPANIGQEIAGDVAQFAAVGVPMAARQMIGVPLAQKASIAASEILQDLAGGIGTTAGRAIGGEPGAAIGGLIGGVGATVVPAVAGGITNRALGFLSSEGNKQYQYGRAGNLIKGALESHIGAEDALHSSAKVVANVKRLGGEQFNPSLAARTGSSAIGTIEHGANISTPQRLELALDTFADSVKALAKARETAFPATLSGRHVVAAAANRVAVAEKAVERNLAAIESAQERIANSVSGETAQKSGAQLEALFKAKYEAMRALRDQKYNDVYKLADSAGLKMDMTPILEKAVAVEKASPNVFQQMPQSFRDIVARYSNKEAGLTGRSIPPDLMAAAGIGQPKSAPNVSFAEFHSLWKELGKEADSAAMRGANDVAKFAGDVRKTMQTQLGEIEAGQSAVSTAFRSANAWFRNRFVPAFREGVGGRLATPGRWGDRIAQEKVVDHFLTPSGMDDFFSIYGTSPAAMESLKQGILGKFVSGQKTLAKGGVFSENAGNAFYAANREALDKVPQIRNLILDAGARNDALIANAQRVRTETMATDRNVFEGLLKGGDADAFVLSKIVSGDLSSLAAISERLDIRHRQAFARIIADNLDGAAVRLKMTPTDVLGRHGDSLKPIFDSLGKDHYRNLKIIAAGETLLARQPGVPKQATFNINPDILESTIGVPLGTVATSLRNLGYSRINTSFLAQSFLVRIWNKFTKDAQLEAIHAATLDPEFAAALAKGMRSKAHPSIINEIQSSAMRLGLKLGVTQESTNDSTEK